MLLQEKTLQTYGYDMSLLTSGSNKKIYVKCDYCEIEEYITTNKIRNKSNKIVNKDCCNKCKYIKKDECCMIKYGTTNPAATQEVKDKIKQANIDKYGVEAYTQTKEFADKANKTKLEKYGTIHAMQCPDIVAKVKATVMEKYGVDSILKVEDVKQKIKDTNLERYGVEYSFQSKEIRDRIKETNLEKYGCENPFANKDIQEKIVSTNNKSYGVDYPMQSSLIKDKSKKTVLENYGVENVAQSDMIKEQLEKTNMEKYGFKNPLQNQDIKDKAKQTAIKNGTIVLLDGKTKREISEELNRAYSTFTMHVRKYGFEAACQIESKENGLEFIIKQILDKNNISYIQHARISGRYTDFLLEEHKLIIETDGLYWHSDAIMKDDEYHQKKKNLYSENGYRSLFFREDEVHNKTQIVESIILNSISKSNRIYARKCLVKLISTKNANSFFNENHLMGRGSGKTYGLYYEGQLVTAMRIRCKVNKDYEISRFCHKIGVNVVGGFSKILSFIESSVDMEHLITFIDRRYGDGSYLSQFGFEQLATYLSFKWVNNSITYHRMKCPGNSGYELGFSKIWDCGQTKFIKNY